APHSFRRFLANWVKDDARWYGPPDDPDSPKTWLIDSGDLTAFGDPASIKLGHDWLDEWCKTLNHCDMRAIYGNHDAWPQGQPVHALLGLQDEIDKQRLRIDAIPRWNPTAWIPQPLSIAIPGTGGARIELYALDSICWGALANTLAVGEVEDINIE